MNKVFFIALNCVVEYLLSMTEAELVESWTRMNCGHRDSIRYLVDGLYNERKVGSCADPSSSRSGRKVDEGFKACRLIVAVMLDELRSTPGAQKGLTEVWDHRMDETQRAAMRYWVRVGTKVKE